MFTLFVLICTNYSSILSKNCSFSNCSIVKVACDTSATWPTSCSFEEKNWLRMFEKRLISNNYCVHACVHTRIHEYTMWIRCTTCNRHSTYCCHTWTWTTEQFTAVYLDRYMKGTQHQWHPGGVLLPSVQACYCSTWEMLFVIAWRHPYLSILIWDAVNGDFRVRKSYFNWEYL